MNRHRGNDELAVERIAIHGVGLLGGSLGFALKKSGFPGRILGLSSAPAVKKAISLGCIDEGYGYSQLEEIMQGIDVLFLCCPVGIIVETIKSLGRMNLPPGLIISDIGSTKGEIMSVASSVLPRDVHYVGGHPMAGSEKRGNEFADPYLFQNTYYVLTAGQRDRGVARKLGNFLGRHLGCKPVLMDPKEHDMVVAAVSHVPHLLAVALVNVVKEADMAHPGTIQLAAGGFRDMTRIAASPFGIWKDILKTNTSAIEFYLEKIETRIRETRSLLSSETLEAAFIGASEARNKIPVKNKGFIAPLHEILVVVRNESGTIAAISTALANAGINIRDIEILKVREGEGGTMLLGFDSRADARSAIGIIREIGYPARERN